MRTERRGLGACLARAFPVLALSMVPGAVRASLPGDFLRPFAGVSTRYDDNLFRFSDDTDPTPLLGGSQRADWTRSVFAGANLDWQPGLQHFTATASASQQTFQRFDFLDNTGLSGTANWNMVAGERFTGRAGASYRRSLGSFEDFRDPSKDVLTSRNVDLELDYWITPDIELRGGTGTSDNKHELASRQAADRTNRYWLIGLAQRTPLGNRLGVEYRRDRGEFPNRDFTAFSTADDGFTQQTASLTALWQGGFTRLDGKLGYAWRDFDHLGERDNGGVSGDLNLRYDYSAKLAVDLQAYRRLDSLDDAQSNQVIESGVRVRPSWTLSDRLAVFVLGTFRDRQFQDFGGSSGADQPEEQIFNTELSLSYAPRSFLTLTAGIDQGRRKSNRPGFDYDYRGASLSFQLNL
jgi:exopolysaccharide biosynthesis operon protein EpsL